MLEKITDLGLSYDGDFLVDSKGDFATVSGDQWIIREIIKIFRTNNPEWLWHPNIGASIETYIGKPNTKEIGRDIEDSLKEGIRKQFPDYAFDVRVIPLGKSEISIFCSFSKVSGMQRNLINFKFDFGSGGISIMDDPLLVGDIDEYFEDRTHQVKNNKYLARRGAV